MEDQFKLMQTKMLKLAKKINANFATMERHPELKVKRKVGKLDWSLLCLPLDHANIPLRTSHMLWFSRFWIGSLAKAPIPSQEGGKHVRTRIRMM